MRTTLAAVLLILLSPCASAADSAGYVRMGAKAWKAFECAALSHELERPADEKQHFDYGYSQGKTYLDAFRAGEVAKRDVFTTLPSGFMPRAEGSSIDFALGRVYEAAAQSALRDVNTRGTYDETRKALSDKYSANDCRVYSD